MRISKEGGHKILTLLSKDMAQSVASIDSAIPTDKNHLMHTTIKKVGLVNKILKTNFDLEKVKSNSKVFPDIKSLCTSSILNIKDSKGVDMYHIYSMYSQANHLRLGNYHSTAENIEQLELSSLEYFIEIYIKFYQQILNTGIFSEEYNHRLEVIKKSLGMTW